MKKYGVHEPRTIKTAELATVVTCPRCGTEVKLEGQVLWCPNCGTEPFENNEQNDGEDDGQE